MAASPITIFVAYPSKHPETGEALRFDMDYYLATHAPLIEKHWRSYGLLSFQVNQFPNPSPLTNDTPPYLVQTVCKFTSLQDLKNALEQSSAETSADVQNFSNIFPTLWIADTVQERSVAGPESDGTAQA
ncbi:hypothetical protein EJ04DRAFT_509084 [Polyplosphaeria fusca]|uniref:EthD domain-containing protein n=1 Tax=Polyplosphaeria fusca TaxID=682080 RepID=A0A9P4R9K0_9PLEO|nr:hypothetical protein EJ04DRAFT_509084 [Polyplosphaeria fusca]